MIFSYIISKMRKRLSRYFIVGIWNTAFAYMLLVILYEMLHSHLHTIVIGTGAAVINVAQSFFVHKIFVFKTKGYWIQELGKSYIVNAFAVAVGTLFLWLLVDILNLIIYMAQAAVTLALAIISYIGHLTFTFRHQERSEVELQRDHPSGPPSE